MKIHGFVRATALANNDPQVTSPVAELSTNSLTFARDVGKYENHFYPKVELVTFETTDNGSHVTLPDELRDFLLDVSTWVIESALSMAFNELSLNFSQLLSNQYPIIDDVTYTGRMVNDTTSWYPSYFTFKYQGHEITLWLSDAVFDQLYPNYELSSILPLENIDDLHGDRLDVIDLLNNLSITDIIDKSNDVKQTNPFTHQKPFEAEWVDKNDPTITKKVPFITIIYGNKGNNLDIIKESIINEILANSSYGREDWEKILPSLFLPNEFYISPYWKDPAIENLNTVKGLYTPTSDLLKMMSYGKSTFANMDFDFIFDNVEHSVSAFKSTSFVAIGNPRNQTGIFKFSEQFPDFITSSTLSGDFDRMDEKTAEFSLELIEALNIAERLDGRTYVNYPSKFSIVERSGIKYLVFQHEKVNYYISIYENKITYLDSLDSGVQPPPVEPPTDGGDTPISSSSMMYVQGFSIIDEGYLLAAGRVLEGNELYFDPDMVSESEWTLTVYTQDKSGVHLVRTIPGANSAGYDGNFPPIGPDQGIDPLDFVGCEMHLTVRLGELGDSMDLTHITVIEGY